MHEDWNWQYFVGPPPRFISNFFGMMLHTVDAALLGNFQNKGLKVIGLLYRRRDFTHLARCLLYACQLKQPPGQIRL